MFKKLVVAVFVFSLVLALGNAAFALKDPNSLTRVPNTLPNAPKGGADFNVAAPDQPPQYSKPWGAAQPANVTGTPNRAPTECSPLSYWDGTPYWFWPIPDDYGDDFFNMRFTPDADADCRLATVALCFYEDGSDVVTGDGVDIIVWDDDGFGFPGTELARINVPAVDVKFFPYYTVVDFTSFDMHFLGGDEFHVGYTTVDQTNDVYALLSDEGTSGTLRSSEYYLGMWGTMYNDWGLDVNFIIEADVCCTSEPGGETCLRQEWGNFAAYYFWTIPDSYGDDFFNVRFTAQSGSAPYTLEKAYLNMYQAGSVVATGAGIDVIVWDDDGLGFPGTELGRVNVPPASFVWFPDELEVDLSGLGLTFAEGEDFHIGYTTVDQVNDVYAVLSDDGSGPPTNRSSEYYLGTWGLMIDDWGIDVDFMIAAEFCFEEGGGGVAPCFDLSYYSGVAYYWTIPDAYGDDYFNMRFTNPEACTLKTIGMSFYAGGTVGNPGADFIIFNSDGTFPTDTIAVYAVNPVTVFNPGFETVDVSADNIVVDGDYHIGYTLIDNSGSDVLAILSDDGSAGTGRSSENFGGFWSSMLDDWGVDVNFLMEAHICCPAPPPHECQTNTEWPTINHDYARTGYADVEVGDLCGFQRIWSYWSANDFCYFANPVIADEKVFVTFGVHLVALDIRTGAVIWDTFGDPAFTWVGNSVRCTPTVADGIVYFSGGSFQSFFAADAATGAVVWERSPGTTTLEGTAGTMRFSPSVILGDYIYFGGDGGTVYKLDKNTGVTAAFAPVPSGNSVWVSPSTNGTLIYFGAAVAFSGGDAGAGVPGGIYAYDTNLNVMHTLNDPLLTGSLAFDIGATSAPSYSAAEDVLFASIEWAQHPSFPTTDGVHYKMYPDLSAHPDNPYEFGGLGYYGSPVVVDHVERVIFPNTVGRDTRFPGAWVRSFGMNTVWQDFTKGDMTNAAAATCDPYVFWGTRLATGYGTWNASDLTTGQTLFSYAITGYGFGSAIARYDNGVDEPEVFVAHTQLWSDCATGGGRVAMYSQGEDRPRLFIPTTEVTVDPSVPFVTTPVVRSVDEVFCNVGCAGLNYCLRLEAHPNYPTSMFGNVNPMLSASAASNADNFVEYSINDFNWKEGYKATRMARTPIEGEFGDRIDMKAAEQYTASAPPSWVTLLSPAEGMLRVNDCYTADFEFDPNGMARGPNLFYLQVSTDDPDFNECTILSNDCGAVNEVITINAVKGFAFCDGYLDFGDGGDDYLYFTNTGWWDDGAVGDAFIVDDGDDPMYLTSLFWMVDSARIGWLEEGGNGFNHLLPDSNCTLIENMDMGTMCDAGGTIVPISGDYFETAVIDSVLDQTTGAFDNALTIGMRMSMRHWGAFGPEFNNFVLVAYDLVNRNATPVDGLYWGIFSDLDMPGDAAGYEQVLGDVDLGVAYQFNEVSGELAGFGTLPLQGSSLDGVNVTPGIFNTYGINNPDQVYPPAVLPDEFFQLVDDCGEGNECYHPNAAPGNPPDDRGVIMTSGKADVAGNGVVSGAFVLFNFPGGATGTEIGNMMDFANKFAGYGRGDVNNDGVIDLGDVCYLAAYLCGGNCPTPFEYLGDVDNDGDVDADDATYLYEFFFNGGPIPISALVR